MEENVRRELETIKGMVLAWEKDFLGWAPSGGGGEFLAQEFREEIQTHVWPYVRRMHECDYLSWGEVREFLDFCHGRVEDLRKALADAKAG